MEEKKNLEVVSGNGKDLDISPVYDHLHVGKPKCTKEKPIDIVIPKETNKTSKNSKNDSKKNEEA